MTVVHATIGVSSLVLLTAAAGLGAWRWYRVEPSVWFWRITRAGQVLVMVAAALGGVLYASGERNPNDLHLLYGLLPIGVSFAAEQLRIGSAEVVLDLRDLPDAQAVGALPEEEQRSIVLQIVRRELGVMTLACVAMAGLLVRAAF